MCLYLLISVYTQRIWNVLNKHVLVGSSLLETATKYELHLYYLNAYHTIIIINKLVRTMLLLG